MDYNHPTIALGLDYQQMKRRESEIYLCELMDAGYSYKEAMQLKREFDIENNVEYEKKWIG